MPSERTNLSIAELLAMRNPKYWYFYKFSDNITTERDLSQIEYI